MTIPTIDHVCEQAQRLPCSPVLMPRLVHVLEDVNSSSQDIEEIIRVDTALAGSTLRLANSAYFSAGGQRTETLHDAITRLGSREIYRLAALSLAGRWMNQPVGGFHWEPGDFCRRSIATAVAAEYLATKSQRTDPAAAYTAGLIHEIGKLAIAFSCADHFPAIRQVCVKKHCSWGRAEREVLGYDHPQVGAELVRRWNFPPSLVGVVEFQPPVAGMSAEVLPLAVHVHAGKFLAASLGAGVSEDGFLFDFNSALLVEWGFTPEVLEAAMPAVLECATKVLGEKLLRGSFAF
ncbi:MAG TPA: HDOD domain-containing protein [Opitutaceae bacterium]|nr:HDOD domain-containing protein [Opitutaceae bacterium]